MDGVEVIDGWKRRWEGRMTASGSRDGDGVMVNSRPILTTDPFWDVPEGGDDTPTPQGPDHDACKGP